ncbi:MAG: hypothetical protein BWY31_02278 [Lentisphaerae bacterium ADurb.Bin242]|nr:MAG: hypothetical protein BWY31_02278 [Lentisphaerae bacterium ADurb.Bin242]
MEFYVYELDRTVKAKVRPIIVITSNNEKELPDAFLRRCFFHFIRFPDAEDRRKHTGRNGQFYMPPDKRQAGRSWQVSPSD